MTCFSSETRKKKIQERAQFSKYLLLPTKHSFPTTVRIYGYVLKFICNARKNRKFVGDLLRSTRVWFSAFPVDLNEVQFQTFGVVSSDRPLPDTVKLNSIAQHFSVTQCKTNQVSNQSCLILDDNVINLALLYLFRKSSCEVKKFVSKQRLAKIAYEVDGILLSKGRLIDGMNFLETSECLDKNLGSLGVKINTPVLDRFSPLSYFIALYIHWTLGKHKGI